MNLIQTEKISKIYDTGKPSETVALKDVSFRVNKGEYLAIQGTSGSGKSTLMHIIGLLDRPDRGEFYLEDNDVSKYGDKKLAELRRSKIGFVFQSFNLLPRLTALENVALPMAYKGLSVAKRKEKAEQILESVELGNRANHRPNELSGGQKQRVAIARALANDPSVILADEPTGNLDSKTGKKIMKLFRELNDKGSTVIIVTHDEYLAKEANRIIELKDGEVINDA